MFLSRNFNQADEGNYFIFNLKKRSLSSLKKKKEFGVGVKKYPKKTMFESVNVYQALNSLN